jgi:inward rectifier potassium channel
MAPPKSLAPPGADYEIRVLGGRATPLRDFYHALLRLPWTLTFAVIAGTFLSVNAVFACAFVLSGGVANARAGSFADAFYFSVQTMGTIGYGAMHPVSTAANLLVVIESLVSLTLVALATGLVFAKFSRPSTRVVFSRHAVIGPMNGVPTLMIRLGNERGNRIVDVTFRAVLSRTEHTAEGHLFYRTLDLPLARGRALSLSRSWMLLHAIDPSSPLYGQDAQSVAQSEIEIQVMVVGLDDVTMQPMHASRVYLAHDLLWNMRLADVLSEAADGSVILDLNRFHDVEPAG